LGLTIVLVAGRRNAVLLLGTGRVAGVFVMFFVVDDPMSPAQQQCEAARFAEMG